jgi:hypothetical protein
VLPAQPAALLLRGHETQPSDRIAGLSFARELCERASDLLGLDWHKSKELRRNGAPALADGSFEESLTQGRDQQHANIDCSGRSPEDRHIGWIATEGSDVLINPSKRRDLIEKRVVARAMMAGFAPQLGMR